MALFQTLEHVERAVAELSLNGFTEKDVDVVIFSAKAEPRPGKSGFLGWLSRGGPLGDTVDRSDGVSVMDGVSVGAVMVGLLGLVFGSRWRLGPVTYGTFGMLLGGLIGLLCDRLIPEKRRDQLELARVQGLILVQVRSNVAARAEAAQRLLEGNHAKQVAVIPTHDAEQSLS
jgi:hypothetical protein